LTTKGIVHKEFVLAGQTANSAYYCDGLWGMHKNMRRLCPELGLQKNRLLHHNAPPRISFFTRELFTKNNITVTLPTFLNFPIEDKTERPPF
jgi:hypothetical protein